MEVCVEGLQFYRLLQGLFSFLQFTRDFGVSQGNIAQVPCLLGVQPHVAGQPVAIPYVRGVADHVEHRPGLLAVSLFSFLDGWNNLLYPLTLATSVEVRTIPPGLLLSFLGQFKHDWAGMMAASVVVTIPVMIIFVFLQRFLVRGLTAGAVKG